MSATASRNSKKAFDNLKWGFNLGPMWPSIGLNWYFLKPHNSRSSRIWNVYNQRQKIEILTIWIHFWSPWSTQMGLYNQKYYTDKFVYSKYEYILKIWSHYDQRQKIWNFDNLDQFRKSLGPPNGPLHLKILHRWFHTENMNTFWKFEASTTKDKNFVILAIFWAPIALKRGPKSKFWSNSFLGMVRWVQSEHLRILTQKLKEEFYFQTLGHLGPFWGIARKPGHKSKFWSNNFLDMVRWLYSEEMRVLAQKL